MLTHKISTADGLTNGASCKIQMLHCFNTVQTVVWVEFSQMK